MRPDLFDLLEYGMGLGIRISVSPSVIRLKGKCGRCHFRAVCGGSRARAYAYTEDYLASKPCCVFEPDSEAA